MIGGLGVMAATMGVSNILAVPAYLNRSTTTTFSSLSSGGTFNISLPSSPAPVQTNMVVVTIIGRSSGGTVTITPPAGWASVGAVNGYTTASNERFFSFWIERGASAPALTFTVTGTGTISGSHTSYSWSRDTDATWDPPAYAYGLGSPTATSHNINLTSAPGVQAGDALLLVLHHETITPTGSSIVLTASGATISAVSVLVNGGTTYMTTAAPTVTNGGSTSAPNLTYTLSATSREVVELIRLRAA